MPTTITPLPPVDPDADRLIGDLFQRYPEARYRLTQTAFVQEHALAEAQSRIAQLQAELQSRGAQQTQSSAPAGGGFFHNLFGGGQSQNQIQPPPQPQPYQPYPQQQYAPQPPPQYAGQPQYAPQPGLFQRSGSGFLGSALTTAAGVAGGLVAGNALMNLFEGNHGYGGGFGGGGFGGGSFGGGGYEPGYAPVAPDAQVSGSAWDNATESSTPAGWDQGGMPDAGTGGGDAGWDAGGSDTGGDTGGGGWDDGSSGGSF